MKIYAISDLHLSMGDNIDKPMAVFGEWWDDHHLKIKDAWDSTVTSDDYVLVPGDLSWALKFEDALADLSWIHDRPGTKLFIKGNHDLWWNSVSKLNALYDDMIFLQNNSFYIEGADVAIAGSRGWELPGSDDFGEHDEKIYLREVRRLENSLRAAKQTGAKTIIAMMHYPPASDVERHSDFTEMLEKYDVKLCVYGHLHGQVAYAKGIQGNERGIEYRLVSVDYISGQPKPIYDQKIMR